MNRTSIRCIVVAWLVASCVGSSLAGSGARRVTARIEMETGGQLASFAVPGERMPTDGPSVTVAVAGLPERWLDPAREPQGPQGEIIREVKFIGWVDRPWSYIEVSAIVDEHGTARTVPIGVLRVRVGRSVQVKQLAAWGVRPLVVRISEDRVPQGAPN